MHKKTKVLHIAQAAGGVDRYLQSLLKYFDREKNLKMYWYVQMILKKKTIKI